MELNSEEGIRHLFRVVSGLESMVLGETEILGQVKKAYRRADRGRDVAHLNKLFQRAFNVAKEVRTKTSITRGAVSVGSAAVELAEKIFGKLDACNVMILGAGETAEMTARALAVARGEGDLRREPHLRARGVARGDDGRAGDPFRRMGERVRCDGHSDRLDRRAARGRDEGEALAAHGAPPGSSALLHRPRGAARFRADGERPRRRVPLRHRRAAGDRGRRACRSGGRNSSAARR